MNSIIRTLAKFFFKLRRAYIGKRELKLARPRTFQFGDGEVSLQGYPKEVADRLQAHIKAFKFEPSVESENSGFLAVNKEQALTENFEDIQTMIRPANIPLEGTWHLEDHGSKPASIIPLTDKAIGVKIEGNKAQVVTVVYNAETKEARVEKVLEADGKYDAFNKFKQTAVELNFV